MNKQKALYYIDEWANHYLRILGEADTQELIEKDRYTILRPKDGTWASVFDVRLEDLSDDDLVNTVNEIKNLGCHVWWNQYSGRVTDVIFPTGRHEPSPDDDEVFAVMLFDEAPIAPSSEAIVKRAVTLEDFSTFHNICFDKTLSPDNLLSLDQKGMLTCYIGYAGDVPVSVTAVLKKNHVYSLELTSTLPDYRNKGFASDVCRWAMHDSFQEGAEVITIRAGGGPAADDASKSLGRNLGFRYL